VAAEAIRLSQQEDDPFVRKGLLRRPPKRTPRNDIAGSILPKADRLRNRQINIF
jgi:hypothetical protein